MSIEMNNIRGIKPTRMLRAQDYLIEIADTDVLIVSRKDMTYQVDLGYMVQYLSSLISKHELGLGNVDNTADRNKPLSLAVENAMSDKATLIDGLIPAAILPGYMDSTIEVDNFGALPMPGGSSQIYITRDTNKTYRWTGTTYVVINETLALGYTAGTAFPGNKGQLAYDHSLRMDNPHGVRAADIGLERVNNTSDLDKPVTNAMHTALATKADLINGVVPVSQLPGFIDDVIEVLDVSDLPVVGERGKIYITIDSNSLYAWSGAIYRPITPTVRIGTGVGDAYPGERGLADRADITRLESLVSDGITNHVSLRNNPHQVTKDQIGLSNVDNTSDLDKPISSAMQTALDGKLALTNGIVPSSYLPSYVDDVVEVADITTAPNGEAGKVYVDLSSNKSYRWAGLSGYVEISKSLAIGTSSGTAMEGSRHTEFLKKTEIVDVIRPIHQTSNQAVLSEKALVDLVEASRSWLSFPSVADFPSTGQEKQFYLATLSGGLFGWSSNRGVYFPIAKDTPKSGVSSLSYPYYTGANSSIKIDSDGEYNWFDPNGTTYNFTLASGVNSGYPAIPASWVVAKRSYAYSNRSTFFDGSTTMGTSGREGFETSSLKVPTIFEITAANGKVFAIRSDSRNISEVTGTMAPVDYPIPAGGTLNGTMYQVSGTKIAIQSGDDTLIWTMNTNVWETIPAVGAYKPSGSTIPLMCGVGQTGSVWGMAYPIAMEGPNGDGSDDYIAWKRPDALDSTGPEVYDRIEGEGRPSVTLYGPYYVKFGSLGVRTEIRSVGGRNIPQIQSEPLSMGGDPISEISTIYDPNGRVEWFVYFADGSLSEVKLPTSLNLSHDKLIAYPSSYDMSTSGFISGSLYTVNGAVKAVP